MADTHGIMIVLLIFWDRLLLTDSKDTNVTCIIHDDCILPCSFGPTGSVVIHWYKQQIPVHSYYYNKDQFGLQNKHFSGRTCLFNSQIPQGNASLLLRRVKVQDKGRYKCYTSTRKGNQEIFINLEVKALIQTVTMEMTNDTVTCSSHSIYPIPQVTWATDPISVQGSLQNSTIKTTDHKGLFTVESTLRILGNLSNRTYFCSFKSADKTQVWTASWKNQEDITQEEGQALSIPCIVPNTLQNFSLTWTFSLSSEATVILRYDSRSKQTFNVWEGNAELDQDLLLLGDGSLLLHRPEQEEHSGTYTCTLSGLQSRHIVRTKVNITVASISEDQESLHRSWWSTAASATFVLFTLFTIIIALPHCVTQSAKERRTASQRLNGAEGGLNKAVDTHASYIIVHSGAERNRLQLHFERQDEVVGSSAERAESCTVTLQPDIRPQEEGRLEENDGLQSSSLEKDGLHITGTYAQTN